MPETRELPDLNPAALPDPALRFILPNLDGDAFGKNPATDTEGVSYAMPGRTAQTVRYGVAYVPRSRVVDGCRVARAVAGAQGAAIVHRGGKAEAGDGGMAYAWEGDASGGWWATAYTMKGNSNAYGEGLAALLLAGSASVGTGGVACALNFKKANDRMVTDPEAGIVSGGVGSVVVAFGLDPKDRRMPVVGFIGDVPDWLAAAPELAGKLAGSGVQFGLEAGKFYRLEPGSNLFMEVAKPVECG